MFLQLQADETVRIIQLCKENATTVNAFFGVACFLAASQVAVLKYPAPGMDRARHSRVAGTVVPRTVGEYVVRHGPIAYISVACIILDNHALMVIETDIPIEGDVLGYFRPIAGCVSGLDAIHMAVVGIAGIDRVAPHIIVTNDGILPPGVHVIQVRPRLFLLQSGHLIILYGAVVA